MPDYPNNVPACHDKIRDLRARIEELEALLKEKDSSK